MGEPGEQSPEEISIGFRGGSSYSLKGLTSHQNKAVKKTVNREIWKEKQHTCQDQITAVEVPKREQSSTIEGSTSKSAFSNSSNPPNGASAYNTPPADPICSNSASDVISSTEGRLHFEILTAESGESIKWNGKTTSLPSINSVDSSVSEGDKQVPYWRSKKIEARDAGRFFANRADRIARAREFVANNCLDGREDGSFVDIFVLTEIDNWNHDRERVVALNQRSLSVINYDFITEKWQDLKRIPYNSMREVVLGPIVYPHKTLLSPRQFDGVKITTQANTESKMYYSKEQWKPFSTALPWTILSSHPLANKVSGNRGVYQIEVFHDKLARVILHGFQQTNLCHLPLSNTQNCYSSSPVENSTNSVAQYTQSGHEDFTPTSIASGSRRIPTTQNLAATVSEGKQCATLAKSEITFKEEQIHMPNYLGLSSILVNQSKLAFALDRNGVCF